MRTKITLFLMVIRLFLVSSLFAQSENALTFTAALQQSEENPVLIQKAKKLAIQLNQPLSIYLPEGIFIETRLIEKNKPVYLVITDLQNPYNGGKLMFYDEIVATYDLSDARINYGNGIIVNEQLGIPQGDLEAFNLAPSFLMFMESTNNKVMAIDMVTGDVLNPNFTLPDPVNLSTPKEARLNPWGKISISDQVTDGVYAYDTLGTFISIFAPAGGINTSILDNVRGHAYRANGNLIVTVASSANANAVAEFDENGVYIGNFIANGAGGLNSPYSIVIRDNDVLVVTSTSDAIHRYDLNGNYLNNLWTSTSSNFFGQQMHELENKNLIVADFGGGGGLRFYSSTGDSLGLFNVFTALRGCYKLGNGNYLVTNAAGLHEINGTTGTNVRTIVSGVSGQFVTAYDRDNIIPVELVNFSANVSNSFVTLNWSTASEMNNKGFQVERCEKREARSEKWENIGFVEGNGTTAERSNYSFVDKSIKSGKYNYRLKQVDFNGSFTYSNEIEVDLTAPDEYALSQNYPNPFNPTTTINYQLPVKGYVTLKVFDILGNEVATLVNENKEPGVYKVQFGAGTLSSGVYFYKLQAGEFSQVKKLILTK